ncbi:MAG: hypothetical protein RSC49_04055 [Clostridium sp.]
MIYKKSANFPYPLLTNESGSYLDAEFLLDIDLMENSGGYRFNIEYHISSEFITELLEKGQASLVLVIQSKDNKFFTLKKGQTYVEIPKTRISLSKKTKIQLSIKTNEEITFKNNYDLNSFYDEFREDIVIGKNSILGFSNVVIFDGSQRKPFELFEKKVDEKIKSSIKIELGYETIIIVYKNESYQFTDSQYSSQLNNPYIYMGLQKALYKFIDTYKLEEGDGSVYIDEIDIPNEPLYEKLYNLMKSKFISELNIENVDEVIDSISDGILTGYHNCIRGILNDRD